MARAEPPRAMESAADIKSFKAHGAIVAVLSTPHINQFEMIAQAQLRCD
jgi:hypothetical protein